MIRLQRILFSVAAGFWLVAGALRHIRHRRSRFWLCRCCAGRGHPHAGERRGAGAGGVALAARPSVGGLRRAGRGRAERPLERDGRDRRPGYRVAARQRRAARSARCQLSRAAPKRKPGLTCPGQQPHDQTDEKPMDADQVTSISKADTIEAIGDFWDTHDFTDYESTAPRWNFACRQDHHELRRSPRLAGRAVGAAGSSSLSSRWAARPPPRCSASSLPRRYPRAVCVACARQPGMAGGRA